ncbi:MAG: bifunctional 4-hydroxy-2-oxoglutarate aldolase/2-dehydro-3-deoxy-phosphogluconate aldolase [Defluviitaleaceae bacterium]|nr:bifunctional 4-hydroxy-2-oxoglutarate aldolase/2-dehydro-3-deoxy-phosphogluconate aldolase [Defluviitaleaceae bacterium]
MKKFEILKQLTDTGVVAVIRAENEAQAIKISEACLAGGVKGIELTFTVPGADRVIRALAEQFGDAMLIGAGTVLDSETARIAILAGANYIISPGFDPKTAKLCNRYQIPYMPGCMTITEMIHAMEAGCDIIKLFPGSAFGPDFVKAVKGPLPQINIMPTGGVNIDNAHQWIQAGCIAVGAGSDLTGPAKVGDYNGVTELAKQFVANVKAARHV